MLISVTLMLFSLSTKLTSKEALNLKLFLWIVSVEQIGKGALLKSSLLNG